MSVEDLGPSGAQEESIRTPDGKDIKNVVEQVAAALRGLRFGNVNLIVQDGVVVQIDRTEKVRLRASSKS